MSGKYVIGLDFGSLSVRALLVDVSNGDEKAVSVVEYADGVIDTSLPGSGISLPANFALQNPQNYIDALCEVLRDVREKSGVDAEDVIGIGIDSTACTLLTLGEDFSPLCFKDEYKDDPHSWLKMWKHHSTQSQADRFNQAAAEAKAPFLKNCGGLVSPEWYFPKVLETLEKSPETANAAACYLELGDWVYYLLTGEKLRCSLLAAVHAQWDRELGYPSDEILEKLHPELPGLIKKNKEIPVAPNFHHHGFLSGEMAEKTGLKEGTAVSLGNSDSTVALLSLDILDEGSIALILGTSSVLMVLSREQYFISGAMASVKDELMPGFYGNVFGQSAVGDIFSWFVNNFVPPRCFEEARKNGETIFDLLNRSMDKIEPGKCGVMALDWFNGCRSMLQDAELSGLLVGMTLATKPEEIYCALVEATGFGLKEIVRSIQKAGIPTDSIRACGGLARKSPEIMQRYADILGLPVCVTDSAQVIGRGSAILGALAAGAEKGGYDSIENAVKAMACPIEKRYEPRAEYIGVYDALFEKYKTLHDYFGRERRDLMHGLR